MTLDQYNGFCASLPAAKHVVQWGGSHVWKVGGKVFAIASGEDSKPGITFKCSEIAYSILKDEPGCRPAPYLASRGMKWIQRTGGESLDNNALKAYLRESHKLVSLKLTRQARQRLGLDVRF